MSDRNSKLNVKKSRGEIEVIVKNKDASLTSSAVLCIENQKQPPEVFFPKHSLLKNFTKFTRIRLCQSLFFKKVPGLWSAGLSNKRLKHICFPVNFAKPLKTPFLQNISGSNRCRILENIEINGNMGREWFVF